MKVADPLVLSTALPRFLSPMKIYGGRCCAGHHQYDQLGYYGGARQLRLCYGALTGDGGHHPGNHSR